MAKKQQWQNQCAMVCNGKLCDQIIIREWLRHGSILFENKRTKPNERTNVLRTKTKCKKRHSKKKSVWSNLACQF